MKKNFFPTILFLITILILSLLIFPSAFKTQSIAPQSTFKSGLNYISYSNDWSEPLSTIQNDFTRFKNDGLTNINLRIFWKVLMPTSTNISQTALNNFINVLNLAHENNLKVTVNFWTQFDSDLGYPKWAGNNYFNLFDEPAKTLYKNFIISIIEKIRYHPAIEAYTILNEPFYQHSSQKQKCQNLIIECTQAAKTADLTKPIMCRFQLSYTPASGKFDYSVYNQYDIIGLTLYLDPSNPNDKIYNSNWNMFYDTLLHCKQNNKQIWVFEYGNDNTDSNYVKTYYQKSLELFYNNQVKRAYAWVWQTRNHQNERYNIYDGTNPKPAYYELTSFNNKPFESSSTLQSTSTFQPTPSIITSSPSPTTFIPIIPDDTQTEPVEWLINHLKNFVNWIMESFNQLSLKMWSIIS